MEKTRYGWREAVQDAGDSCRQIDRTLVIGVSLFEARAPFAQISGVGAEARTFQGSRIDVADLKKNTEPERPERLIDPDHVKGVERIEGVICQQHCRGVAGLERSRNRREIRLARDGGEDSAHDLADDVRRIVDRIRRYECQQVGRRLRRTRSSGRDGHRATNDAEFVLCGRRGKVIKTIDAAGVRDGNLLKGGQRGSRVGWIRAGSPDLDPQQRLRQRIAAQHRVAAGGRCRRTGRPRRRGVDDGTSRERGCGQHAAQAMHD